MNGVIRRWRHARRTALLWTRNPPERLGRRGACLVLAGILWILIGITIPEGDPVGSWVTLQLPHLFIPTPVRIFLWTGSGAFAIATAWSRDPHWSSRAFTVLLLLPAERVLSFTWGGVAYHATRGIDRYITDISLYGYDLGFRVALVWTIVFMFLLTIAGWQEPVRVRTIDDLAATGLLLEDEELERLEQLHDDADDDEDHQNPDDRDHAEHPR